MFIQATAAGKRSCCRLEAEGGEQWAGAFHHNADR
jgi:hypothetical protein